MATIASRAISFRSGEIVVSEGAENAASDVLSQPTTATSSGTEIPASRNARRAPMASRSFAQTSPSSRARRACRGVGVQVGDGLVPLVGGVVLMGVRLTPARDRDDVLGIRLKRGGPQRQLESPDAQIGRSGTDRAAPHPAQEAEATSAGFDQAGGGVVAGMHVVNDDAVDAGAPEPLAEEDERCCAPFGFEPLQVNRERTEQDTVGEDGAESRCHP